MRKLLVAVPLVLLSVSAQAQQQWQNVPPPTFAPPPTFTPPGYVPAPDFGQDFSQGPSFVQTPSSQSTVQQRSPPSYSVRDADGSYHICTVLSNNRTICR
jgi:hypothetical protein